MSTLAGPGGMTENQARTIRFHDSENDDMLLSRCSMCGQEIRSFASYAGASLPRTAHNRAKSRHRDDHYWGVA